MEVYYCYIKRVKYIWLAKQYLLINIYCRDAIAVPSPLGSVVCGLGTQMVNSLVRSHVGTLDVESEPLSFDKIDDNGVAEFLPLAA